MTKVKLRFMDYCAGIGAGRLGLERGLNGNCVGYSEIMKSSVKTYNILHNTKNEKNFGDLKKINTAKLPDFDVMIAGFPCQTFSIIGQRKGFEDDRGQIIYHLIKILKDKRVPYFILENVKGLINHDRGNTIKVIIKALEVAGYHTSYKVLNSLNYGVPQMRERVYFVGVRNAKAKESKFIWPDEINMPDVRDYFCDEKSTILDVNDASFQKYLNNKYNKERVDINDILKREYLVIDTRQSDLRTYEGKVPTLRTGRHGILYVKNGLLRRLSGFESLLLQGFDKEIAKRASGEIPEQYLLSQAGNAMTVSAIEAVGKQLLEYIKM
ncbi:MAG: DNA (cytosine-5-)-methyltransferase [Clostridiales Family XIII bacterium]|jgi:DNA (cytosine-5)-methyltransferase 1|nr:DNA (cytosine-5-)-methyltransferase [Clostridiales Family XIII bacterium]